MIKTVFVDVDDTLVLFDGNTVHPYGVLEGRPYKPNLALIEKLNNFEGYIVVWSGGGRDYARTVAIKVMPEELRYQVSNKEMSKAKSGDIVIDDQKEYFGFLEAIGVYIFNPFEEWILKEEGEE